MNRTRARPQTSMVIDKLIPDITREFNMTTVINTHDMNSVMEMAKISYICSMARKNGAATGRISSSKNERLNKFIFASEFLQDAKDMRMLEATGKIANDRNMDDMLK